MPIFNMTGGGDASGYKSETGKVDGYTLEIKTNLKSFFVLVLTNKWGDNYVIYFTKSDGSSWIGVLDTNTLSPKSGSGNFSNGVISVLNNGLSANSGLWNYVLIGK